MITLLQNHGKDYMRIPFEIEEYRKIGFDIDALPKGLLASKEFELFEDVKKDRLKAALYRLKNNYVMNNNGARNAALLDGREHARSIFTLGRKLLPHCGGLGPDSSRYRKGAAQQVLCRAHGSTPQQQHTP